MNNSYFSGLNHHILGGIEGVPVNCLEIGCAYGRLGEAIKRKFPGVYYVGIDQQQDAVIEASKVLDLVLNIDLNSPGFMHEINQAIGTVGFDLIIIGDTLEHLCQPEQLLESLHHLSADNAQLILCVPNSAHYSVIERVFTGDLSYDSSGLLDNTHLRLFSPASCLKIMLNTGWLPSIYDQIIVPMPRTDYYKQYLEIPISIGIPIERSLFNLECYQMLIRATKSFSSYPTQIHTKADLSVIVPVNREWQFNLNILKSPGLKEISCNVVKVTNASSAADALARGKEACEASFLLLLHQDVYLPRYSGILLASLIEGIQEADAASFFAGFIGLAGCSSDQSCFSSSHIKGLALDRQNIIGGSTASQPDSIDEFALLIHRDSPYRLDPSLGWHLWGTDLCLQAKILSTSPNISKVLRIPIMHNSLLVELPQQWHDSAAILRKKWTDYPYIHSLCGTISNM